VLQDGSCRRALRLHGSAPRPAVSPDPLRRPAAGARVVAVDLTDRCRHDLRRSPTTSAPYVPSAVLGEHTQHVLHDKIGLGARDVEALRAVSGRPALTARTISSRIKKTERIPF
jgi:hypothetical protein